jgi:asparagine synthase (glutamine-hydrolysing)
MASTSTARSAWPCAASPSSTSRAASNPFTIRIAPPWIVFNGEIYNYLELREKLEKLGHTFYTNSDTEAIVHAYDQFGADCPKHLRGMFAFAIWNERKQELFLARDRVGKKPLLYAEVNGQLIFGSEFSALLLHPGHQSRHRPEALDYYLSFMCIPAPLTAYRAIRKLEPGHWLRWRKGEHRARALLAA